MRLIKYNVFGDTFKNYAPTKNIFCIKKNEFGLEN
jgi:hypothetical protein